MCVDVISVYSPPVDTGFKEDLSVSVDSSNSESSAITSSASSSSFISCADKQKTNNPEKDSLSGNLKNNNENSLGSKESDSKSCLTDSEHASDNPEEDIFESHSVTEQRSESHLTAVPEKSPIPPQPITG